MIDDQQRSDANAALRQIQAARYKDRTYDFQPRYRDEGTTVPGREGTSAPPGGGAAPAPNDPPIGSSARTQTVHARANINSPPAVQPPPAGPPAVGAPVKAVMNHVLGRYGWLVVLGVGVGAWWWVFKRKKTRK